jgi:hypothetical protein
MNTRPNNVHAMSSAGLGPSALSETDAVRLAQRRALGGIRITYPARDAPAEASAGPTTTGEAATTASGPEADTQTTTSAVPRGAGQRGSNARKVLLRDDPV